MKHNQTQNNTSVITVIAKKNYGKTTVGKYVCEVLNKPCLVVDIAEQFTDNAPFKRVIRGLRALKYYFGNKFFKKAFYNSKTQVIYRFNTDNKQKEANDLFEYMNNNIRDITIFCEEMELYADQYLKKSSPIFETVYLCRNKGFDIIVICKIVGALSPLVKDQTDIFIVNTNNLNAIKYLDERSNKQFSKHSKSLKHREFLVTDLDEVFKPFKLDKKTIQIIK